MSIRLKMVLLAWVCAFLITGCLSPNLFSLIPFGTASAHRFAARGQAGLAPLFAQQLAADEKTRNLIELNTRYQLATKAERQYLLDDFRELAASRRQVLAELIENDAAAVLRVALPAGICQYLPGLVRDYVEDQVEIEGELEVTYECWEKSSRLHYLLRTKDEQLSLHFAGNPPTDLMTGSRVRAKGVRVGEALAVDASSEGLQRADFQTLSMAIAPNTLGQQKVLILLVNFQDKQTQPFSISQVQSTVFGSVNDFYKESSYQQTWLTGDVFGWYTLPISSTNCDTTTIATYAKQAATAAGVNLAAYNRYVYAFPSISCGWTGWGTYGGNPSQAWINGSMSLRTVAHELGHGFGLYHARSLDCGSQVVGGTCTYAEYGDIIDILGQAGVTGHSHANQKERLGWLGYGTSPGLTTVQASGTYWIDPYETVGSNPKALKILKSTNPTTGQKTWYYVEFRRPLGFDSFISGNNNVMNGVMVHTGTEGYSVDDYLLDMTPETSSFSDAALVVSRSYTDPDINLTITPLSVSNTGASVNVSFGPQPCVHANPSVTLSPSQSQWIVAGSTVTYQVSITNNDSGGCSASDFTLQAGVPSGWTAMFGNPALNINPSASATTTLTITSPASAADGFYNVSTTVATSAASYSVTASATCVIISSLGVAVSPDQASYTQSQTAILTAVVSGVGSPVSGASVTFTIMKANGSTVRGTATTGADGTAIYRYRFNKKQDAVGTYQVTAVASRNGITGSGNTSFTVR